MSRVEERQTWVRIGSRVSLCFAELIGTDDGHRGWDDYPCLYCGVPIKVRDWWWHVPDLFLPRPQRETPYEYGYCAECVALFRIRPRDVPREQWMDEMWERGAGDRWSEWPLPSRLRHEVTA